MIKRFFVTNKFDNEGFIKEVIILEEIRKLIEKQVEGEDIFLKIHSLYGNRISLIIAASIVGYSWKETDKLLEKYNYGKLYSRNIQDAICIYALNNSVDIIEMFSWLIEHEKGGMG